MAKHKCKVPPPPADTSRWLGTYGDMVTLLMAFFVMLFAVSETNAAKFEAFVSGLAGPFDNPAVELGLVNGQTLLDANPNNIQMIIPVDPASPHVTSVDNATSSSAADAAVERQLGEVEEQIEAVLEDIELPISADIRDSERGLVVSISTDDVLFQTGSTALSEAGVALLAEIAPILIDAPNTIVVEGHTDDVPLNRGGYTNWNLSTDRAVAVIQRLGDVHGLPYDRISASGYAEQRPLVPNDSAEGRATNRRVEILIVALAPEEVPEPPIPDSGGPFPPVMDEGALDFSEELPVAGVTDPTSIAGILGASPP